jgi:hypothetical protein
VVIRARDSDVSATLAKLLPALLPDVSQIAFFWHKNILARGTYSESSVATNDCCPIWQGFFVFFE